jgi:ferredoxin
MPMKVHVDHDRCEGNGRCVVAAPDVFELGDDDIVRVRREPIDAEAWEKVERAVRSCPRFALSLTMEGE